MGVLGGMQFTGSASGRTPEASVVTVIVIVILIVIFILIDVAVVARG